MVNINEKKIVLASNLKIKDQQKKLPSCVRLDCCSCDDINLAFNCSNISRFTKEKRN